MVDAVGGPVADDQSVWWKSRVRRQEGSTATGNHEKELRGLVIRGIVSNCPQCSLLPSTCGCTHWQLPPVQMHPCTSDVATFADVSGDIMTCCFRLCRYQPTCFRCAHGHLASHHLAGPGSFRTFSIFHILPCRTPAAAVDNVWANCSARACRCTHVHLLAWAMGSARAKILPS